MVSMKMTGLVCRLQPWHLVVTNQMKTSIEQQLSGRQKRTYIYHAKVPLPIFYLAIFYLIYKNDQLFLFCFFKSSQQWSKFRSRRLSQWDHRWQTYKSPSLTFCSAGLQVHLLLISCQTDWQVWRRCRSGCCCGSQQWQETSSTFHIFGCSRTSALRR